MRAELVLFGKRIDMARRSRRRALIVVLYAGFVVLLGGLWCWPEMRGSAGSFMILAVLLACHAFLGGTTTGGLVKPFNGKAPKGAQQPATILQLRLRMYQPVLDADREEFRNDERELAARDRAHYWAYQVLGYSLLVPYLLTGWAMKHPDGLRWLPGNPWEWESGLLVLVLFVFMVLPQTILIWSEPDMEEEEA